jgi:hypothetical protein
MSAEEEVVAAAEERASALAGADAERLRGLLHETFRMPMTQVWVRVVDRWTCLAGHAGTRRS